MRMRVAGRDDLLHAWKMETPRRFWASVKRTLLEALTGFLLICSVACGDVWNAHVSKSHARRWAARLKGKLW